ncbi:hypothetical protein [uncultured Pontibacter sp.]|uniref:hypothetical protein n=1 Tax=uncultured Pontibacter sp. TaxID=453356 RepID=UPI002622553D|nr:hypothetical protein [uncultured Pontibacter sp.]
MKEHLESKKNVWKLLPHIYFTGLAAFWFFGDLLTIQNFSLLALGVSVILIIQAIIQNKTIGICMGIFAAIISLYTFFAVLSEFNDFGIVNNSAIQLITVGSALSLGGLAMGVTLTLINLKK